jgi:superfamily II DNA/RNA helicase
VLAGRYVVGIANTGTGKTAAFALPIIHKLMSAPGSRMLVIAPTRELAQQIEQECKILGKGSRLTGALLIGVYSLVPQLRDLKNNPRAVICTPGRIKDHLERGTLQLNNFDTIILDEVDRMLDMGFVNDVTHILGHAAKDRQSLFFSATMDARVMNIISTFTSDPVTVTVKQGETSQNVHQDIVAYETNHDKITQMHNILIGDSVKKVIIFDDTQRAVDRLHKELETRGFKTDAIHGGKTQGYRQRALKRLKNNEVSILVATDVAARGLDINGITHVINYSTPQSYDDYIHRIGRAGRAGNIGNALTFVTN